MELIADPAHVTWLDAEMRRLVSFGAASVDPRGGFGWLSDDGTRDASHPIELWITCRMTHVYSLAELEGIDGAGAMVEHGLAALAGPLRDAEYGGWFSSIDNGPVNDRKEAYAHAFVILATSSAVAAGHSRAAALLGEAIAVHTERFWDDAEGMARESFSRDWTSEEDYRGVNANMHTLEAYLAASDVLDDEQLLDRALRIVTRVVDGFARGNRWRLPEHFTREWEPLLDFNADLPAHPFRPFGATIGHGLEWARLTLQAEQSLARRGVIIPGWMADAAESLYETAVRDGWDVDGAPGFVYTVDWEGNPVVRERMHWVAAEAIGAAAVLFRRTKNPRYTSDYERWWAYTREYLIDLEQGSWRHELDRVNSPSRRVWEGKADLYHAVQATLFPRLPIAPALAASLATRHA
ncbi:MAG: AGE family epimerase/isomerase [Demequinaceae bacterium]|nr:AGE family epimerase/isomerase [Demequinaceae bacterium]